MMIPTPIAAILPALGLHAPIGSFIADGRFSILTEAS